MRIFFLVVSFIVSLQAIGQQVILTGNKKNTAYVDVTNPLTIHAGNQSCTDIFASTNNGKLEKKDSCTLLYTPEQSGTATITIQKKQNGKLISIGEYHLTCDYLPRLVAVVGNKTGGDFSLAAFKIQQGVAMMYPDADVPIRARVYAFKITLIHNNQIFFTAQTAGHHFNEITIDAISKLKSSDVVKIEDIKFGAPPNGCPKGAAPLIFTMR